LSNKHVLKSNDYISKTQYLTLHSISFKNDTFKFYLEMRSSSCLQYSYSAAGTG